MEEDYYETRKQNLLRKNIKFYPKLERFYENVNM